MTSTHICTHTHMGTWDVSKVLVKFIEIKSLEEERESRYYKSDYKDIVKNCNKDKERLFTKLCDQIMEKELLGKE